MLLKLKAFKYNMKSYLKFMKEKIVIAGGGIAGMYTALSLSKYNRYSVTLVDQKRDLTQTDFNTLGSFLDVESYGIPENVIANKIDSTVMYSSHTSHRASGQAYILDKTSLHRFLQNQLVRNGVILKLGNKISGVDVEKGHIKDLILGGGTKITGDLFVDATGIKAFLGKQLKLTRIWKKKAYGIENEIEYTGPQNQAIFYIGNYVKGGYGWLFPLKNSRAIIGIGTFDKNKQKLLRDNLQKLLSHPSIAKHVKGKSGHIQGGAIPIGEPRSNFVINNLVCVGDSVGQVNPMVGEGYRFIIDSAEIAAVAINRAIEKKDLSILHEYEDIWREKYLKDYRIAYKLQQFLDKIGNYDLLLDLGVLFLHTKRDSTVERLYAGRFSKQDLLLP